MDIQKQSNDELQKVAELIGDIKFAMLTTQEADGKLRSRPLSTLQFDAQGQLWFFTSISSPKMDEIAHHNNVSVIYANPDKQDYVSISGAASVVRDREKMKQLWTPWIKPWFPQGLDDPDLVLLKVTVEEAEYWDAPGSAIVRAYGLAKAIVTGNTDALGPNKKVQV
ncbi:MAG: pyridoxamine 5'-phosphate oxidase family protein [Burkholderiales bacterium]